MGFCWILQCLIGLSIEGNHDKLQILEVATISDSPLVTTELMSAIFLLVHVLGVLPVQVCPPLPLGEYSTAS